MFIDRGIVLNYVLFIAWVCTSASGEDSGEDGSGGVQRGSHVSDAHEASCAFESSMCGWLNNIQHDSTPFYMQANVANVKVPPQGTCTELSDAANEVKGGGGYAHSMREQKMRYWKTICDKRCYYLVQQSVGRAEIESQEFKVDEGTLVLQVNFSYWLENANRSAQLQLLQVPTDGPKVSQAIKLWSSDPDLKHTDNWNATVINIVTPISSKTLRLAFWGTIAAEGDLIAIDRISVGELTRGDLVKPVEQMARVSFKIESEGNPYVCPRNTAAAKTCSPILFLSAAFLYRFIYFR